MDEKKAVFQVARGLGHEFGNILFRIMGKTDLALEETSISKVREHLRVVMNDVEYAGLMLRNLQFISYEKMSGRKLEPVNVNIVVDEALALMNSVFIKSSVQLKKRCEAELPMVCMDSVALKQVFWNLLSNASHAVTKGGAVEVVMEKALSPSGKAGIVVRITDNGSGISSDVLSHLFECGFSTKGDRGSGLGLFVSKGIIENYGGSIEVSTEQGMGSCFSVWLPSISSL